LKEVKRSYPLPDKEKDDGTVGKALGVLDMVAGVGGSVRFSQLLAVSDLPKATLYRILQTLTSQGMLKYDTEKQTYNLGVRLVRLAHAAWRQSSLAPLARPFLEKLAEIVRQTVHLAQLDNGQVLYIDKINADTPVEMFSNAGKVGPGYCTGVGKAMLAFLEDEERQSALSKQSFHPYTAKTITGLAKLKSVLKKIRAQGYSVDDEEHESKIVCVAVPILTSSGKVLGGISITGSTDFTNLTSLEKFLPTLKNTAKEIAQEAQMWNFPAKPA